MFPVDPLLQKVNQILGKDYTHRTHLETILDLTLLIEKQQKELQEAHERELSYIDDIEQMDVVVDQAQKEIKQCQLQETLLNERLKKLESKSWYPIYEENLRLAKELALLKGELSG